MLESWKSFLADLQPLCYRVQEKEVGKVLG